MIGIVWHVPALCLQMQLHYEAMLKCSMHNMKSSACRAAGWEDLCGEDHAWSSPDREGQGGGT